MAYLLQWLDGRSRGFLGLGTKIPGVNHHVGDHGLTNHDLSVIVSTAGYKHYHSKDGEILQESVGSSFNSGILSQCVGPNQYHVYAIIVPAEFALHFEVPDRPSDDMHTGYVPISTVRGRFAVLDADEDVDPADEVITKRTETLAEIQRQL